MTGLHCRHRRLVQKPKDGSYFLDGSIVNFSQSLFGGMRADSIVGLQ
jgi:hypothetical protein